MTSRIDSNPEDEGADDQDADHDAGDRELPSRPADIPHGKPEEDVLEQRQEVPYREDDPAAVGQFAPAQARGGLDRRAADIAAAAR
jgi:hypothetical protein